MPDRGWSKKKSTRVSVRTRVTPSVRAKVALRCCDVYFVFVLYFELWTILDNILEKWGTHAFFQSGIFCVLSKVADCCVKPMVD